MEKQIIKNIIGEKQQQLGKIKLSPRPAVFDKKSCYVLVGIRRAGKSYTLYQDIQSKMISGNANADDFLYINFEDERIAPIQANELGMLLEAYWEMYNMKRPLIYLDEIQNVIGWEKFARRLAEEKYRVMITGSNAKMLSKDIASFPWRQLYPTPYLSFFIPRIS
jgi:hypothetical protein